MDERSSIETSDKSCKNTPDQNISTNDTDFNKRMSDISGSNLNSKFNDTRNLNENMTINSNIIYRTSDE